MKLRLLIIAALIAGILIVGFDVYVDKKSVDMPAPLVNTAQINLENAPNTASSTTVKIVGEEKQLPFLSVNGKEIPVEIADSQNERTLGLSGRESLAAGTGLWFIFPNSGAHAFWMKDMHFAIDIIWFDENLRVVTLLHDISPQTFPETFYPAKPARYVLEINAGEAKKIGLEEGMQAMWLQ